MNRKSLTILFAIAMLVGSQGRFALAQSQTSAGAQLASKAEQEMAANSKKTIIETGISEPYFNEHFRLIKVVNEAGDRHVEWKYSINEYETLLVDDIGYNTTDAGQRIDVHSIRNELFSAYDIKTTISRSKAESALKSCIGKHSDTMVVYRPLKTPGKARLYLTARSTVMPDKKEKDREGDKEPEVEIEKIFFNVGFVDLESGQCVVVRGQG